MVPASFEGHVLVHLPVGFVATGSSSFVKDHGPLKPYDSAARRVNVSRRPSCFPVPESRESVWPASASLALLSRDEEEPLLRISLARLSGEFCTRQQLTC